MGMWRSRWAAVGAAVAVAAGAGGVSLVDAGIESGDKPVTVTISPERVLDTRVELGLAGAFTSEVPRDVQITGDVPVASGGTKTVVPADAVAVLVNVTIVNPTSAGFLSLRPGGSAGDPTTSTVNFLGAGAVEPNAATVDLAPDGTIQVYVLTADPAGTADVLIDIVGYTIDHNHDDRYYTETEIDALVAAIPAGPAGPAGAQGPVGPPGPAGAAGSYEHVIVVAEDGGDFTSVVDAMAAIGSDPDYPAASSTERYLVWVAPGAYDGRVVMQPYVDIEGAGQGVTTLQATAGAAGISPDAATVVGASNAELRELSVEVTPSSPTAWSHAIYTSESTTFREIRAVSSGGGRARGMVVVGGGAPILIDVVLNASGGSESNLGLDVSAATVFGDGVFASVSGGVAAKAIYVQNASSEVTLENVTTIAADASTETYGFQALNSDVSLEGYRTRATGSAGDVLGARCNSTERFLKILDGTIFSSNSGGQARGVFGSDCSLELRDMVIDAIADGAFNAQGIDHFSGSPGVPSNISIADVEIRAESTAGTSYGIQTTGNPSAVGSFGEVRDATIRSISGGLGALNYGVRQGARGEIRYRTLSITLGGEANWAYGVQATGGTPRFDDIVIDAVVKAETTVFGAEVFTPGSVLTNIRARAINTDSGSVHDAVGLKSNGASNVIFRDASAYAEAERNAWGLDVDGGSARMLRYDGSAVSTGSGGAFGARCFGNAAVDVADSTFRGSSSNVAHGLILSGCNGQVDDTSMSSSGGISYGLYIESFGGTFAVAVRESSMTGSSAAIGSFANVGNSATVDVVQSALSGGSSFAVGTGTSTQTCTAVTSDAGGLAFTAGPAACP